jgi:hypothetical protein
MKRESKFMQDDNKTKCAICGCDLPSETAECADCASKMREGKLYQPVSFRKLWRDVRTGLRVLAAVILVVAAVLYVLTSSIEEIVQALFRVVLTTLYALFVSFFCCRSSSSPRGDLKSRIQYHFGSGQLS